MIPPRIITEIETLQKRGWTGRLAFNFKDGAIIEIEHSEKERLDRTAR